MREFLNQNREKLRQILSEREAGSERPKRDAKPVESVSEMMQAAARIGTVAFAFWVAKEIKGAAKGAKGSFDEITDAWRNQGKAERDMKETLRKENEKDTAKIRKDLSDDQVERERKKVKFRPKGVRGHWEGNVFIPNVEPSKRPRASKAARDQP